MLNDICQMYRYRVHTGSDTPILSLIESTDRFDDDDCENVKCECHRKNTRHDFVVVVFFRIDKCTNVLRRRFEHILKRSPNAFYVNTTTHHLAPLHCVSECVFSLQFDARRWQQAQFHHLHRLRRRHRRCSSYKAYGAFYTLK